MMKNIGREIHRATGVFHITTVPLGSRPRVLDLCLAPGGFSSIAMQHSPDAHVRAFSLPPGEGGHRVRIGPHPNIAIDFLDVNMLAADMGADAVPPPAHPDADNFLPRRLRPGDAFDLVICDGQVLRTHPRAPYREAHEAARLGFAQLALGLGSVRRGGTMLGSCTRSRAGGPSWSCAPSAASRTCASSSPGSPTRSAPRAYMVASDVQPQREEARRAVDTWKRLWRAATFGSDGEYDDLSRACAPDVGQVLEDFGPTLIGLGAEAWEIQASALSRAPFLRQRLKSRPSPGGAVTE
ncbi:hypothetical protein SAMD00023353_1501040 [Rosellinia necatrix]|uniref:Ribosomal RNA methyltransferase FtsJ domain-containing protein n=1 Tax=Rosellinia necatrix TaxID=77044 RepID=A0A1W2TIY2_ROSNE|nr:hypothetical protein SAMD00023353_1501040 [Rosellinia necatrix]